MAYQKIDSLTSLRFFAAAAIVVYHARGHFGLSTNLLAPFELSQGVSFFFVLSGFILAFVYPNLQGAGATGKFWLARFARVWPLHLATFLLYVLLLPEFSHLGLDRTLANLALVQAWMPNQSWFFSFNSVSWSISTEAFFYLAFPLLIKDFEKTWLSKLGACLLLVFLLAQLANCLHLPVSAQNAVSIHGLMYINPLSRLFEFVLGMTVAHFYRKYLVDRGAPLFIGLCFEVLSLAGVYLFTVNTVKISNWLARLPCVQEGGRMWLEHGGVPVFSFALLIAVMAWGRGPIAQILRLKPLVVLGEVSFATYLLHRLFLHYYWNHFAPEQGPGPIAIYVAMLLASSFVLWSLIEVPCRQFIVAGIKDLPRPKKAGAFVLAGIAAACFGIWSGAPLERLDPNASELAEVRRPTGDIAFGDDLLLLGTKTRQSADSLAVTLYWQALHRQKLNNYVDMQLLSEHNVLVRLKNYRQSAREEVVQKDECFKNILFVPSCQLQYVHSLAFGLVRPIGQSPKARILRAASATEPDRQVLYKGLVAVQLSPPSIAGKQTKPVL